MDNDSSEDVNGSGSFHGYAAMPDDSEPVDAAWVFANFPSMGPQYSARQRSDCRFLVWQNRFERFTAWDNPVPQLKTRGDVRMLLFVLAGITNLSKSPNSCPNCESEYKTVYAYE